LGHDRLTAGDLAWILPAAGLAGAAPRVGDKIVDASAAAWTIDRVAYSPLTQIWRATARQQR
jgi:hypothetical protein